MFGVAFVWNRGPEYGDSGNPDGHVSSETGASEKAERSRRGITEVNPRSGWFNPVDFEWHGTLA